MKECFSISKDNLVLRPIAYDDLELMINWRNKNSIRKCFISQSVISIEQQINWFNGYLNKKNDIMYIIEWNEKPVGNISLYDINSEKNTAEFGRLIIGEESVRGLGIGKKATKLLCEYGFNKLNLNNIYLEVFIDNKYAIDTYESVGFVIEKETIKNEKKLYYMTLIKERINYE